MYMYIYVYTAAVRFSASFVYEHITYPGRPDNPEIFLSLDQKKKL